MKQIGCWLVLFFSVAICLSLSGCNSVNANNSWPKVLTTHFLRTRSRWRADNSAAI